MFTIEQKVRVKNTDRQMIVAKLHSDLKPGKIIIETKFINGSFAGFYQEQELESVESVEAAEHLDRLSSAMHLLVTTAEISLDGEALVYLAWDENDHELLYTFKLMPSQKPVVFSIKKP